MAPPSESTLEQLRLFQENALPGVLEHNAEAIFALDHDELKSFLDDLKTIKILRQTREELLKRFSAICPKYTPNLAKSRSNSSDAKHAYIQDILLLGNSIIAKSPVDYIGLVYNPIPEALEDYDLSSLGDNPVLKGILEKILKTSLESKQKVEQKVDYLEGKLLVVESENTELKDKVAILEARLGINDPSDNVRPTDSPGDIEIPSEPEMAETRPVKGVVKTANAFIGDIQAPCSSNDIQEHIKNNTTVSPKLSDITQIKIRGDNLAFRVTVPKNKLQEVISQTVWGEHIKAEPYDPNRSMKSRPAKGPVPKFQKKFPKKPKFQNRQPNKQSPLFQTNTPIRSSYDDLYLANKE